MRGRDGRAGRRADRDDPARLQRFAEQHRVSWGVLPVALLPLLDPDRLPHWRTVVTGAEAPGPEQVRRWAGPADAPVRRFLNCYGPTEATVCVTAYETAGDWDRPVPMGRPLPNQRVYVVDADLNPVPSGVAGELLLGGVGLARGYLGAPGLTARRFVPDPYGPEPGARLYRTGDRAVRLPGGDLLFLGRLDRQVKVRGQRIEPGEVEAALAAHPAVAHAVVAAVDGPAGTELVAFAAVRTAADPAELREHCRDRLPAAAVPARVVVVDRLPLTASGKVDLAALLAADPVPGHVHRDGAGRPGPRHGGPSWTVHSRAWGRWSGRCWRPGSRCSARPRWTRTSSPPAATRSPRCGWSPPCARTTGRAVSVEDVFAGRTCAGIGDRLAAAPPLEGRPSCRTGSPPALSPAQRRLWFADKLAPESAAYNIALAERLRGPLDRPALAAALAAVAERHEVLRWRVPDRGGVPAVAVDPPGPYELPVTPGAAGRAGGPAGRRGPRTVRAGHRAAVAGPAAAARAAGPRARAHLPPRRLRRLVAAAVPGRPGPGVRGRPHRSGPGAAADPGAVRGLVAGRVRRDAERGPDDLRWWTAHLAGAPPVLDLPRDRPRPPVQTHGGDRAAVALSPATSSGVRALAARVGGTAPAVLFAAFAELAGRITGRDDLVVGTPTADRRHPELHPLVGFFVDIVPLRARLAPGASFAERARAAADELVAALAHPGAPLEQVVESLGVPRDPTRSALVQVLFNVYNFPEPRLRLPGLRTERAEPGLPGSAFDLTLYAVERDGAYTIEAAYNPDLYDALRIRRLLDGYAGLLGRLVADPEAPVEDAELPYRAELSRTVTDRPAAARTTGGAEAATETERLVARVWQDTVGRPVRATDGFFDVGGTSMAAVVVQARLAELTGAGIRVVDVFRYPSVRALAAHLDELTGPAAGTPAATGRELDRAAERAAARRGRGRTRAAGRSGGTGEGS